MEVNQYSWLLYVIAVCKKTIETLYVWSYIEVCSC